MCRLFGLRAKHPARVERALLADERSLRAQSREHRDGWGIAYYEQDGGPPSSARGVLAAHADPEFERLGRHVASHAVVAHVRLASVGRIAPDNAHPFVRGRWTFAHNGTVEGFAAHRELLESLIEPSLRESMRGETDSERCFLLFLTELSGREGFDEVALALGRTVRTIAAITDTPSKLSSLNFLVTNGQLMVATRRRRSLFFAAAPATAVMSPGVAVTDLAVSSEVVAHDGEWREVPEDHVVGLDEGMRLRLAPLAG